MLSLGGYWWRWVRGRHAEIKGSSQIPRSKGDTPGGGGRGKELRIDPLTF